MFDFRPSPVELLTAAARTVAEWNPHEPSELSRAEMMLAGRAAAVALREACFADVAMQTTAREILEFYRRKADDCEQQELAPSILWARLAKDIRTGRFDNESDACAVHALLTAAARRWLQIDSPNYAGLPKEQPATSTEGSL